MSVQIERREGNGDVTEQRYSLLRSGSKKEKREENKESMEEIFKDLNEDDEEKPKNWSKTKTGKGRKNRNDKTHFYRVLCIEVPDDKATVAWWFYFFLLFFFFFFFFCQSNFLTYFIKEGLEQV